MTLAFRRTSCTSTATSQQRLRRHGQHRHQRGRRLLQGHRQPGWLSWLPNATKVYVANSGDKANAISIGNNVSFEMNNAVANMSGSLCSSPRSARP